MLSLISIIRFRSDADYFVRQHISNFASYMSCENLALNLAINIPKICNHMLIIFYPVCQQRPFVIFHNDQTLTIIIYKFFGLGTS